MVVREGFEPSVPFTVRRFSKALLSTTQPPHQLKLYLLRMKISFFYAEIVVSSKAEERDAMRT